VTDTVKLPAVSTLPIPINTSFELPHASLPQSKMLMHEFGFGFGIAVPVTVVDPASAPPVMTGVISGVGVNVAVGVTVAVLVGVPVAVRVGVIVADEVPVGVWVAVDVLVAVFVAVLVGDVVGVEVLVPVAVAVAEGGGVLVTVAVRVTVGELVAVPVGVCVPVGVLVPVGVGVAVRVLDGVGVGVKPTTMLPFPGVHGTGVSKMPGRIANPQLVNCSALVPFACPWNVMLSRLIGGVGTTGVWHASEQFTFPTGGVGAGVAHEAEHPPRNGGSTTALVACTIVESY
jgi:hypothetical protein